MFTALPAERSMHRRVNDHLHMTRFKVLNILLGAFVLNKTKRQLQYSENNTNKNNNLTSESSDRASIYKNRYDAMRLEMCAISTGKTRAATGMRS